MEFSVPVNLTHFTVTSGNDTPGCDPVDWAIQGSNDGVNYTYPVRLAPGTRHFYAVEVKDAIGNTVRATGEFNLPLGFFPTADLPSRKVVNKAWAIRHIFGAGTISDIPSALAQIQRVGKPGFTGVAIDYTSEVINYSRGGLFANDLPYPDAVTRDDAWTAEDFIQLGVANLEIPEESDYTFGVHSDDGFALRIRGGEAVAVFGNGELDPADPEAVIHPANTGDSSTRAVYRLKRGVYRIEFFWWDRGGDDNGEIYAAKGRFANDADTDQWKLVGDNNPSKTFVRLGVDASGWTVTSSDPGNPPNNTPINNWADANAAFAATGGGAKNYDTLNVGDPDTSGGVLPFPKNSPADDDDCVLRATAKLVVPVDGDYLLGFNSDDGAFMTVKGQNFIETVGNGTGQSTIVSMADGKADSVFCDCLTVQSDTTAKITLKKGTYDIVVGMFERGGGSFLRVSGGRFGAPLGSTLTRNGAGVFTTAEALHATDKPVGILAGGITNFRIVDLGRTGRIKILFDGTGVIQSSTKVASGYTDTAIKSGDEVATLGASQFFRVKP